VPARLEETKVGPARAGGQVAKIGAVLIRHAAETDLLAIEGQRLLQIRDIEKNEIEWCSCHWNSSC